MKIVRQDASLRGRGFSSDVTQKAKSLLLCRQEMVDLLPAGVSSSSALPLLERRSAFVSCFRLFLLLFDVASEHPGSQMDDAAHRQSPGCHLRWRKRAAINDRWEPSDALGRNCFQEPAVAPLLRCLVKAQLHDPRIISPSRQDYASKTTAVSQPADTALEFKFHLLLILPSQILSHPQP